MRLQIAMSTQPGPPAPPQFLTERTLGWVKAAVMVMSVVLVAGFALVMILISRELATPEPTEADLIDAPVLKSADLTGAWWRDAHVVSKLNLPKGGEIEEMTLAGDRLALLVAAPEGRQIILFDLVGLREIGVIRLAEEEEVAEAGAPPPAAPVSGR